MLEKNRLKKVRKHVFYKQINIVTKKWVEKKARKFFSLKHTYIASKKQWKKSSGKVRKHVFYKYTNIVTKKWGEKTREKVFPETHVFREF